MHPIGLPDFELEVDTLPPAESDGHLSPIPV